MKNKIKLKGKLKFQFSFMLYMGFLMLLIDVGVFTFDVKAGILLAAFIVVYFIADTAVYLHIKPVIMNELISFATQYGQKASPRPGSASCVARRSGKSDMDQQRV